MPSSFLTDVKGFTPVIDALAEELGLIPAVVYGIAWRFCQMKDGVCHASLETIAKRVGISRATAKRHMKALCSSGYLQDLTPDILNRPHRYRDTGKAQIVGLVTARVGGSESDTSTAGRSERPTEVGQRDPPGRSERPTSRVYEERTQESSIIPDRAKLFRMIAKAGGTVNGHQSEQYALLLEEFDIDTIALGFAEIKKQRKIPRHEYLRAILVGAKARGCKPGSWTPERVEPPGKPYARDGPLRTIRVKDTDGKIIELEQ